MNYFLPLFLFVAIWLDTHFVAGDEMVLVLGDSMACGTGLYPNDSDYDAASDPIGNPAELNGIEYSFGLGGGFCVRDQDRIPGAFVARERNNIPLVNLACAASLSSEVVTQWNYAKEAFNLENAIILITLGANDAVRLAPGGLYSIGSLMKCFNGIFPFQTIETDSLVDWVEIESRMDGAIKEIVQSAPLSATVRVVSYPLQFRPHWDFICWSITFPCARSFDAIMTRLNSILKRVTETNAPAGPDLEFVSIVWRGLLPSAVCSLLKIHIRGFTIRQLWPLTMFLSGSSFHPKEEGNIEIAKRVLESL